MSQIWLGEKVVPVTALVLRNAALNENVLQEGDLVKVSGLTKGRGFAGVVKRHHFAGGPKTHGQSDRHRAPGSIGSTTTPGRVYKGKRMAGRMGGVKASLTTVVLARIKASQEIIVRGPVPGSFGGQVVLEKIIKV